MSVVTDNAVSAKKAAKFKFVFITTFGSLFFRRKIRKWKKKLSEQFPKIFQPLHTNLDVKKVSFFIKSCSIIMSTLLSKEKTSKLAFYLF